MKNTKMRLWFGVNNKTHASIPNHNRSRYDYHLRKVNEIFQKPDNKHKREYLPEQMCTRSHLIQMEKHTICEYFSYKTILVDLMYVNLQLVFLQIIELVFIQLD